MQNVAFPYFYYKSIGAYDHRYTYDIMIIGDTCMGYCSFGFISLNLKEPLAYFSAQSREVEVVTDDDDLANVQIPSKKQKSSQSKEDETASLFCPICLETYAKVSFC